MKKNNYLFYVVALFVTFVLFSCSSSSDDIPVDSVNPETITGVYTIENFTLTFYDNCTFGAKDNNTGRNYTGAYTYNAPDLILSGVVATRAFFFGRRKDV